MLDWIDARLDTCWIGLECIRLDCDKLDELRLDFESLNQIIGA